MCGIDATRKSHRWLLRAVALVALAGFLSSGCGLIRGMQGAGEDNDEEQNQQTNDDNDLNTGEPNECGGDEELTYQGEPAEREDPCGPCDNDYLVCGDDPNTLECSGESACAGPAQLTASSHVDHVLLSWEHVDGADEYIISRDGDPLPTFEVDPDTAPGAPLEYADDDADPVLPETPQLEASDGEFTDGIELSWEPVEVAEFPDEHHYEIVAVHSEFDPGISEPVEATERRSPGELSHYEFRTDVDGWDEWSEIPSAQSVGEELRFTDPVENAARLPTVSPGTISASEGALGYDVTIELHGFDVEPAETGYELRAVTDGNRAGDPGSDTGYVGAESLHVELLEAEDDESTGTVEFEEILDVSNDANAGELLLDTDVIQLDHTPPDAETYFYRAEFTIAELEQTTEEVGPSAGFVGEPALFTASMDETVRRVRPNGEQMWVFDEPGGLVRQVSVDPGGNIYAGGDQGTLWKIDFQTGDEIWEAFNIHSEEIIDIAVSPDGYVYTASRDGTVKRIDADDGSPDGVWAGGAASYLAVSVDPSGNVYAGGADGYASRIDDFGSSAEPSDDVQWQFGDGEDIIESMLIAGDDVYWADQNSTLFRAQLDGGDGYESTRLFDVDDLVIYRLASNPSAELYFSVFNWFDSPDFPGDVFKIDLNALDEDPLPLLSDDYTYSGLQFDLSGNLYYAIDQREFVVNYDQFGGTVNWVFEDHVTDDDDANVWNIAVTPGPYGTFPDAWDEFETDD